MLVVFGGRYMTVMRPSAERRFQRVDAHGSCLAIEEPLLSNHVLASDVTQLGQTFSGTNPSWKRTAVIHAFPLDVYCIGMVFMLIWWKHRGDANLPMNSGCNLCVPVLLQQNNIVTWSLASLNPSPFRPSLFIANVRSGNMR